MRILLVHLYEPQFQLGGASRGVLDLAAGLQESPGVEVQGVMNAGPLADEFRKKNILCSLMPRSKLQAWQCVKALESAASRFRPDVIHSNHRYATVLLDIFLKSRYPILHTERVVNRDKKLFARFGDYTVSVSESVKKNLVQFYKLDERRVSVIRNAVRFQSASAEDAEKIKIEHLKKDNVLDLLFVGRFGEQKGVVYLVRAVAALSAEVRKKIRFFLAGEGPLEESLKAEMKKLKVESSFIFLGYRENVAAWLQFCDALILPSLWEGLPRVVIEAFCAGKAAIVSSIPENRELVTEGYNGFLSPPRDALALAGILEKIVRDPESLRRCSENAILTGKTLSFEFMMQEYKRLYHDLAVQRGRVAPR